MVLRKSRHRQRRRTPPTRPPIELHPSHPLGLRVRARSGCQSASVSSDCDVSLVRVQPLPEARSPGVTLPVAVVFATPHSAHHLRILVVPATLSSLHSPWVLTSRALVNFAASFSVQVSPAPHPIPCRLSCQVWMKALPAAACFRVVVGKSKRLLPCSPTTGPFTDVGAADSRILMGHGRLLA